jgi:maltooligosyltrehalose trehalohydrolase
VTFEKCRLNHDLAGQGQHAVQLRYYQKLLELRRSFPALCQTDRGQMSVLAPGENVLVARRAAGSESVLLLYSFASTPTKLGFEKLQVDKSWIKLLDSTDKQWDGPGSEVPDEVHPGDVIVLQPRSCAVFRQDR